MQMFRKPARVAAPTRPTPLRTASRAAAEALEDRRLFATAAELDPTFGAGGTTTVAFPKTPAPAGDADFVDNGVEFAAVDSRNGLTVVAGAHRTGSLESGSQFDARELALARLDPAGRLDPTFGGGDGVVFAPGLAYVADLFVLPDNAVLVIGSLRGEPDEGGILMRFTPAGTIDAAFGGGDGTVAFGFHATGVRATADGKIVVAGDAVGTGDNAAAANVMAAARLLPDGSLDASFGSGGLAVTDQPVNTVPVYMAVQPDGKVLLATDAAAAGSGGDVTADVVVARLTAAGAYDPAFGGGDGRAAIDREPIDSGGNLDVASDGSILVGLGRVNGSRTVLARLRPDGTLDEVFDPLPRTGYVTGVRAAFDGSGKALVFGTISADGTAQEFGDVVVRYNPDGTLDRSFDGDGILVTTTAASETGHQGDLQNDGRIVTARGFDDRGARNGWEVDVQRRLAVETTDPTVPPAVPPTSPPAGPPVVGGGNPGTGATPGTGGTPGVGGGTGAPPAGGGTLAAALTATAPAEVVAGSKAAARVAVAVTNPTAARVSGRVTVGLVMSADDVVDAADPAVATAAKKLKLNPGQTKTITLKVRQFPAAAAGTYRLAARVTAPDQTTTAVTAADTFAVADPVVELAGTLAGSPAAAVAVAGRASATVRVENRGNVRATGPHAVSIYLSTDATYSEDDQLLVTKAGGLKLDPGKAKNYRLSFRLPPAAVAGAYHLVAAVDAAGQFEEPDEANNLAATPFTIR